jgi:hypothetical protein
MAFLMIFDECRLPEAHRIAHMHPCLDTSKFDKPTFLPWCDAQAQRWREEDVLERGLMCNVFVSLSEFANLDTCKLGSEWRPCAIELRAGLRMFWRLLGPLVRT